MFVTSAAPLGFVLFLADESLVGFDRLTFAAQRAKEALHHGFANAMGHEPSALVGNPQEPVELMGSNALLARSHEVNGHEPLAQGDMATLEEGADRHCELELAGMAEPQAGLASITTQTVDLLSLAAMRAEGAIGPTDRL